MIAAVRTLDFTAERGDCGSNQQRRSQDNTDHILSFQDTN